MKFAHKLSAVAGLAMVAAAYAQPASFTDLGDRSTVTQTFSQSVTLLAANDIQWFKIVLPSNTASSGWVDIWTNTPGDITDSEIGIYDDAGNLVNGTLGSDDDSGPGLFSQLTFGQTTPTRPAIGTGLVRNGADGVLAGGTYWVAVGRYQVTFALTGWGVTSTYTSTQRTCTLNFDINVPGAPTNPVGVGAYSPNTGLRGSTTVASVTVTPGDFPPSTGLAVSLDASLLGAGTIALLDNGVAPDVTAGDNIFSANVTIGASATLGANATPFTVTDAQTRSSTGNMTFTVTPTVQWDENVDGGGDAGDATATAQTPAGTDPLEYLVGTFNTDDVDVYKIRICGNGTFSITTNTALTGTQDTQLFLFDGMGAGVIMNDDAVGGAAGLRSTLDGSLGTPDGTYYLAVTRYDRDPLNAGGFPIWEDTPFQSVRAPDGLTNGGDITLASWSGTFTATNVGYGIQMTGVCFASDVCAADYNADTVVDFFDYLDFVADFSSNAPSADFNADTVIDFFDYLDFVAEFSTGC